MLDRLRTFVLRPPVVLAAAIVVACVYLIDQSRRLYFFGDDWEFLLQRNLNWNSLMRPHNEHWSFLPVIAFRVMVQIFGVAHYPAYALMPIVLHAACCVLLYLVMRRNGVAAWPAAIVVIPFAFLCGNLAQNPLWDFQIGFLGSAMFGLLALLSVSGEGREGGAGRNGLVWTWLAMVGSFLCSGMAIPMLVWLGGYVLLSSGLRRALLTTVPPTVVYLVWYVAYGHDGLSDERSSSGQKYIEFVTAGLSNVWEQVTRFAGTGGVVLIALFAVAWLGPLASRERALALSGAVSIVAMFAFIGLTRSGLGPAASLASRYGYFGVAFTLPAAAAVCTWVALRLADRQAERVIAALVVVIALVGNGVVQSRVWVVDRGKLMTGLKGTLAGTEQLVAQHAMFLRQEPSPTNNPNITVTDVRHAMADGNLHRMSASPEDVLAAAAFVQVASGPKDYLLPVATILHSAGMTGRISATGCSTLQAGALAHLDMPPSATGSEIVIQTDEASLSAQLIDGAVVSPTIKLGTLRGQLTYVGTTASQATLRIDFEPGPVTICLSPG